LKEHDADAHTVERIARGDQGALSILYDRYAGLLVAIGTRVIGMRSEAEDVLHDVFLEVWKRAGDFDPERGTVRGWLCLRMRSRSIDRKRSPRFARTVAFEERVHDGAQAPVVIDTDAQRERKAVRDALEALPAGQRELLELCYFHGASMAEASEKIGIPVGTVKSRLSAARDALRAALSAVSSMGAIGTDAMGQGERQ